MFEAFLVTSSSEGLRALGQKEQRSYELIVDAVKDRLGQDHALLFGEPVATQHGDQYDWYAPLAGKAERLTDLAPEQQASVRAVLDRLVGDISVAAAKLKESRNLDELRLGEALENAVRVPSDSFIYVVQGTAGPQPVLVNWAWVSDEQRQVRGVLTGADSRAASAAVPIAAAAATSAAPVAATEPASASTATVAPRRRGSWLWWLIGLGWILLALLLLAILVLVVRPCGLAAPWLSFCPAPAMAVIGTAETSELENQILAIERQLAAADRACQPPQPVPDPAPVADSELQQRMSRSGATLGELTFTLVWDSEADIDLSVTCPAGRTISYRNRSACDGYLDVDSNAGTSQMDPIENIYFNSPSAGQYGVRVNLYGIRTAAPLQRFELTIQDGDVQQTYEGQVTPSNQDWSMTYSAQGQQ